MLKWIGFYWLVHYTKSRNVVWNPRVSSLFIIVLLWLSLFHTLIFLPKRGKIFATCFFFPTRITCCRRTFKEKKQTSSLVSLSATIISHSQATCLQSERLEHAIGIAKYSYCMTVQTKKTMSSFVSPTIALLNKLYRRGRLHLDPSVFAS